MKFKELLNIDKALTDKKKELEALREEAEELQMIIDINMKQDDTIDIQDVYVVNYNNIYYFCQKKKEEGIVFYWTKLYDIFSGKEIICTLETDFLNCNHDSRIEFNAYPIRTVFPEVNAYPNEQVPRLLLQKLYYQVNGIGIKTLKKTIAMGNKE